MKKILVIVVVITVLAGVAAGVFLGVIPAMERKAVNEAMQGYFDNYVLDWEFPYVTENLTEEQKQQIKEYGKDLTTTYRKNVREIGERKLEKLDNNTYMVYSRKEAPNLNKITETVRAKVMLNLNNLPDDVNEAQRKIAEFSKSWVG